VEVQPGVVGGRSPLPELARAAAGMIPNIAALARAARVAGIPVVHCTAESRADGRGGNRNARLFGAMRKRRGAAVSGSEVHEDIGVEATDLVLPRLHGLSPMTGTSVDPVLRNLGVTTIVGTGVSVNVAIMGLAFEAVNLGYQLVLPRDATAGVGEEYVDAVYEHTLSLVATVAATRAVLEVWEAASLS
jgi:biuret amidohydrolase